MRTEVIQEHTLAKLIKLDFNESAHLLPSSSVDVGFAANGVLETGRIGKHKGTPI